jgi:hypothetical protein
MSPQVLTKERRFQDAFSVIAVDEDRIFDVAWIAGIIPLLRQYNKQRLKGELSDLEVSSLFCCDFVLFPSQYIPQQAARSNAKLCDREQDLVSLRWPKGPLARTGDHRCWGSERPNFGVAPSWGALVKLL